LLSFCSKLIGTEGTEQKETKETKDSRRFAGDLLFFNDRAMPSQFDPTTSVNNTLTALTTTLEGITAPTAGNRASTNLFLRSVGSAIGQAEGQIAQAVNTAVQNYNNSLP
jgi:hypothetical protein